MLRFSQRPENSAKIAAIVGLSLLCFAVYGLYCFNTVSQVKINGPQYQRIAEGNDIVADILPPREYLVETYLTAFEMMDAEPAELSALIAKARTLKAQFLQRNGYWDSVLAEDSLKHILMGRAAYSGRGLLATMETGFIPALQAGDRVRALALLRGPMREQFEDHRKGIDAVVRLALVRNRQNENSVARMVHDRTLGQVLIGLFLVALLAAACFRIVCKCEANLKKTMIGMLIGSVPLSRDIREKMMWN